MPVSLSVDVPNDRLGQVFGSYPADVPMIRGSAAWIRPREVTVSAHHGPVAWWLSVSIRGYSRNRDRFAPGAYNADLVLSDAGVWHDPALPWLTLPQGLINAVVRALCDLQAELEEL